MIQPTAPGDTSQWTSQRVVLTTLGTLLVGLGFWLVFRFYNVAFIFSRPWFWVRRFARP